MVCFRRGKKTPTTEMNVLLSKVRTRQRKKQKQQQTNKRPGRIALLSVKVVQKEKTEQTAIGLYNNSLAERKKLSMDILMEEIQQM